MAHDAPRERALATLAPHLPEALVAEALAAAASPEAHARVLAARTRHASAPDRARSLPAVLARVAREADQGARARALVWLATALPAALVGRAVAVAQGLESCHASGHALLALSLHVPANGLAPVRAAADVDPGTDRAGVVTALVRRHVADWVAGACHDPSTGPG